MQSPFRNAKFDTHDRPNMNCNILFFLFQGALTHGDRRAGESRDLSRFNIDNKYGRAALEAVFKAIMGYEAPVVKPPAEYKGDFFKGIIFFLS